jgi:hypothetical protein
MRLSIVTTLYKSAPKALITVLDHAKGDLCFLTDSVRF